MEERRQGVPVVAVRSRAVSVEIGGRTLAAALAVVGVVWLAGRLSHLLLVLVFAVLLATAIDAPVSWLQRRRVPRPLGILAHYLLLLVLFAVVVLVLVPLVSAEVRLLRAEAPGYADLVEGWIARVNPAAAGHFSFDRLAEEGSANAGAVAGRVTAVTLDVARTLLYVFVTFVLAFFLAAEPGLGARLVDRLATPGQRPRLERLARQIRQRIGGWARGQAIVALLFGLAMGIGLKLLGVPYAASLGTVAAVLEIVPYVGGAITVVLAGVTALTVGLPQFIGVLVLYVVLVNLEAHVLAPWLFGRAIGLPPVVILVALLAGVDLLGVAGALLAVPVAVVAWVVADELLPRREPAAPAADDRLVEATVVGRREGSSRTG